jgi:hypothetical protein
MKSPRKSDRYLISSLLLVLCGLIGWLCVHMGWISPSLRQKSLHQPAGYVSESYNQLRRKSQSSLKWEKASLNDEVFNYDSVMTLEKSQATIRLNNKTEIHLSENTLITIEPASSGAIGDIKMRLEKGNFRATAGGQPTNIETEDGVITVAENSEVDFKQSDTEGLKIEFAKDFHLVNPRPREIVRTDEDVIFAWTSLSNADSYKFILLQEDGSPYFEKIIHGNSFPYRFKDSQRLNWKVIGLDQNGKTLRDSESQSITAESSPFEAPEVEEPELRAPSSEEEETSPGAWWIRLLISPAMAAEKMEAVFSWKPVKGADLYKIEVSETSDFKSPLLAEKVKSNEFTWTGFKPGIYFWRVAAASFSGRSGVFTKPTKVDLAQASSVSNPVDGVLIRKSIELQAQMTPVETDTEEVLNDRPDTQFEEQAFAKAADAENPDARDLRSRYFFQVLGSAAGWTLNNEKNSKAVLDSKNNTSSGAHFQTEQEFLSKRSVVFDVSYLKHRLTPKPDVSNPLLLEQGFDDIKGKLLFGNSKSTLTRGIVAQTLPVLETSEIKSEAALGVGILYLAGQDESPWKNSFALDFVAGSNLFALSLQNQTRYQYADWDNGALSIGINAQADTISIRSSTSFRWNAGLTLGMEFY